MVFFIAISNESQNSVIANSAVAFGHTAITTGICLRCSFISNRHVITGREFMLTALAMLAQLTL
jgi:hypothetical protein